uniref:Uncharacterized protein n=1 Tax=Chlamydomonas euryale TaxID=1486919 RepID=A0A7R9VGF6_9CHLO|mmetsp:Transcript_34973/g.103616  ORF Transcript_34973/g.103616 Transcript_34973/m.103616 type:complete len:167 (+) Transcript_34973:170-670(+)
MAAEAARRERPACMHACTQRGPRCRVPTPACLLLLACLLTLLQPNGVACMRAQRAMRRGGLEGAAQRIDAAAAPPSSSPSIFTQSAPLHAAAAERLRLPQTQSAAAAVPSPMPNACKPLLTGYAPVGLPALNYSMYYAYWEAQQPVGKRAPVLLWLQARYVRVIVG